MQIVRLRPLFGWKSGSTLLLASCFFASRHVSGQEKPKAEAKPAPPPPSVLIEIPDEPRTVDPMTLMPARLGTAATVNFAGKTLKDVAAWLQDEQKINVQVDQKAFADARILMSEPVADGLDDAPLYLLLNRLRTLGVAWYMQGGTLHLTTIPECQKHQSTVHYNLGDLLDAGFDSETLASAIRQVIGGPWEEDKDNNGGASVQLGDVLFVRHSEATHREVAGLLAALRKHGRRTFTLDAPQHAQLRQTLEANVTVDIQDQPLATAVQKLSQQIGADLRLDNLALAKRGVRDRTPVSLKIADQKLTTALQALLSNLNLTWILRDSAIWITTKEAADEFEKTAVFDVRDLCRDDKESMALVMAIRNQTRAKKSDGRGGALVMAKPGVLVVRNTEPGLDDVLQLLENYRAALRASKPRKRGGLDPKEVITRHYRLPTKMADDLILLLPVLVQPDTWKQADRPNGPAKMIIKVTSKPSLLDSSGLEVHADGSDEKTHVIYVENSTLIIRQSREVHDEIVTLIQNIEHGDAVIDSPETGGSGGQQGGFGGGFFSLPPR